MDDTVKVPPPDDPELSAEGLAAEFVQARLAGNDLSVSGFLSRLPDSDAKRRFLELIAGAESVDALLPRQVREGTVLSGRYRIHAEIGAGGMGKVFVAWDEKLKREVAVKVLATIDTAAVDVGSMFERESELLAQLQHPGIVSIHETAMDGDTRYLVMDLVHGRALKDVLGTLRERQGDAAPPRDGVAIREAIDFPMPDGGRDLIGDDGYCRVAARIGAEMVRTIEAAHAKGVVHRDLKPGNVMINGDGTPVLLDFGLAGRFDGESGELTRALFGSAPYLAPEQARSGETGSDPASDVYQLGLLLYELLTLRRAFPGDEVSSVLQDIGIGRFDPPRKHNRAIPVELEAITLKAMELSVDRRYETATELREDLERFLSGAEAPKAMGGGVIAIALRDARYFVRRHRLLVQVAAALLVGGLVTWKMLPSPPPPIPPPSFAQFTFHPDPENPELRIDPDIVQFGDYLGVEVSTTVPRWIYAYSIFGPDDDPRRYVASLTPKAHAGSGVEILKDTTYARRIESGTTQILCAEATETEGWEGLLVFALEERDPVLEWWLTRLEDPMEREVAIQMIKGAKHREVYPVTRGKSVEPYLSKDEAMARLESAKRIEYELPFDNHDHKQLMKLRVTVD